MIFLKNCYKLFNFNSVFITAKTFKLLKIHLISKSSCLERLRPTHWFCRQDSGQDTSNTKTKDQYMNYLDNLKKLFFRNGCHKWIDLLEWKKLLCSAICAFTNRCLQNRDLDCFKRVRPWFWLNNMRIEISSRGLRSFHDERFLNWNIIFV